MEAAIRAPHRDGSSPLARGLLGPHPGAIAVARIIPARAGFTQRYSSAREAGGDHPRSRGVYFSSIWATISGVGSSPLARGLRRGVPRVHRLGADHPRSRGVYPPRSVDDLAGRGSSPLARGLLLGEDDWAVLRGIIPARAGFTVDGLGRGADGRDHPRSRGVYVAPIQGAITTLWIIPARAGFTLGHRRDGRVRGDHPRSRGVYTRFEAGSGWSAGSSPLARGLPGDVARVIYDRRIIPARAGFTPRRCGATRPPCGSSPLARGLQGASVVRRNGAGIIPARAGFTSGPLPFTRPYTDHPRSRGVYPRAATSTTRPRGSSPLARGLPGPPPPAPSPDRIIPARAGFTRWRAPCPWAGADHPRSRGVYPLPSLRYWHRAGSSPLARGLHMRRKLTVAEGRIIPARAGFTRRGRAGRARLRDHPRSRGVYHPPEETLP